MLTLATYVVEIRRIALESNPRASSVAEISVQGPNVCVYLRSDLETIVGNDLCKVKLYLESLRRLAQCTFFC